MMSQPLRAQEISSDDLGEAWKRIEHGVRAQATRMAVALDPTDQLAIHCVSRCGRVFNAQDGGGNWTESWLPEGVTA